jgi:hypothetical protein
MSASDRFYLWVGVNVTTAPTANTDAILNVEGTLNGNYDSTVTVPLPNSPPSVSLTSPLNGAAFNAPSSIALSASASDSNGINKVEFFEGANKLGETTTSPYNFTWNNPTPASYPYSLTAKATDGVGFTTSSTAISVTVGGAGILFLGPSTAPARVFSTTAPTLFRNNLRKLASPTF